MIKGVPGKFQRWVDNWVSDRLENDEPLMLNSLYEFMRESGYEAKELYWLKDKIIRANITSLYREGKKWQSNYYPHPPRM